MAVVVTGADLRLAVISDSHGRLIAPPNSSFPQYLQCLSRISLRIHHNAKDSLWLKILSCYVPAFSHIRRGGPSYSPTTR
ncbi:hypothetical protein, partial [Escherichia coli]|uniref:hypothetical protein n=1 Tax=Escherichia coli TaxID=562 RepID=UPI001BDCCD36